MGLSPESRLTLIHKFVWVFFELTPRALSRYNVIVANLKTHIRILFGVTSDATEPQDHAAEDREDLCPIAAI